MTSEQLANHPIYLYIFTMILASIVGLTNESFTALFTQAISPYIAFFQIPLTKKPHVFVNKRFIIALVVGNFIIVPILVWLLTYFFTPSLPALMGIDLVLLTPCIDYVVVLTHLGKGNAKLVVATTSFIITCANDLSSLIFKAISWQKHLKHYTAYTFYTCLYHINFITSSCCYLYTRLFNIF